MSIIQNTTENPKVRKLNQLEERAAGAEVVAGETAAQFTEDKDMQIIDSMIQNVNRMIEKKLKEENETAQGIRQQATVRDANDVLFPIQCQDVDSDPKILADAQEFYGAHMAQVEERRNIDDKQPVQVNAV